MTEDRASTGLQSMTGYGAVEGEAEGLVWRWELRSVNGKGLDVKLRMPTGTEGLETELRSRLRALHRGSVSVNLRMERDETPDAFTVDDETLAAVASAIAKVQVAIECDKPRPEAILQMRGVLSSAMPDTALSDAQLAVLRGGFDKAFAAILSARKTEGARVAAVLAERCTDMATRINAVREKTAGTREQIAERIRGQISDLLKDHVTDERLAQEAAMLAIRADVTEELDRLEVHTQSFRDLLQTEGAAGRRLEFLTQELMREASTLTAKLHSAELKNEGLDLKELIDGLREQVLNIA